MSKPIYVTTTIPYVNAAPHIGFALELVQADALARYYRLVGTDVRLQTGTDAAAVRWLARTKSHLRPRILDERRKEDQ